MTPQELKNSILQLAIQGKLVEQRPEEGTAAELYKQIQAEKQELIKAGKIKKEKPLPQIPEDEVPFEIPESWMWVRLNTVISLLSGSDLTPDQYNSQKIGIPYITGASNIEGNSLIINRWTEHPKNIAQCGDLLLTCKGTVGKTTILTEKEVHIARQIMAITPVLVNTVFIQRFIECQIDSLKSKAKSMIPGIERDNVLKLAFPLPPLAEQKRIVAKIEELLPLIERYEKAWSRLEDFNKRFPGDMQKSILQMAIQGKLVEQRPEEGTGEELYKQIQAEKQALIKAGKIKKEKPLPKITEDEIPFEIPESWKWVRFADIATFENGDRSSRYPVESDYVKDGIPFFGAKDMGRKYMVFTDVRYISVDKYNELGNGKLIDKEFICLLRGSVGKCAIFAADDKHKTGFICAQMIIIRCLSTSLCDYIFSYLSSPYYAKSIESKVTGTAVRQLPGKELGKLLIPLPPLAEQKRIVARLEELLPLCERLK